MRQQGINRKCWFFLHCHNVHSNSAYKSTHNASIQCKRTTHRNPFTQNKHTTNPSSTSHRMYQTNKPLRTRVGDYDNENDNLQFTPLFAHTMIIAAIIPYSFSFCFSISHFNFCASERNNYSSRLPSSSTSAVSARASVLSTIMSSFSPRSMILSAHHHFSSTLLPMLSIITPFTASSFCCTRVAASALGSFHFFCTLHTHRSCTISWAIVEEKSDIANA